MTAAPSGAITGGTVDDPAHPAFPQVVVLLTGLPEGGSEQCSGTLVSPVKVLTAAHCVASRVGRTIVSTQTPAPDRPTPTPTGGWVTAPAGWVLGDAVVHPNYQGDVSFPPVNDVAVITLSTPITAIQPKPIAPAGYLDRLNARPGGIQKNTFTVVGYGSHLAKPDGGPQRKTDVADLTRRYATVSGQTMDAVFVRAVVNVASSRADGATCFGDSGGPLLHDGAVTAVLSWGHSGLCTSWAAWQRVDIPQVRTFLAANDVPLN